MSITSRTDTKSANPLPVHSNANLPLVHRGQLVGVGSACRAYLGGVNREMEGTMAYNSCYRTVQSMLYLWSDDTRRTIKSTTVSLYERYEIRDSKGGIINRLQLTSVKAIDTSADIQN